MDLLIENTQSSESLIVPKNVLKKFPLTADLQYSIKQARLIINNILQGHDNRLLVIVGPCSIHDYVSALEYANLLKASTKKFSQDLFVVMRTYFEKPRTLLGWKGFINDPFLDNSFDINKGLHLARKLLLEINKLDLPTATEFLNPIVPSYLADLIAWCAVGARTSSSPLHRELASGLTMPVGFKNSVDGNIKVAMDAVKVSADSHRFFSINQHGKPAIVHTPGNKMGHIILRGSHQQPNYDKESIQKAAEMLRQAQLTPRLVVDCSHGNSNKQCDRQLIVAQSLVNQIASGSNVIAGIMLESHLLAGKQSLTLQKPLIYGQSITDACIAWDEAEKMLACLAKANAMRRQCLSLNSPVK